MISLLVTTCVIGMVCKQVESPVAYDDMESCFNQAAIIASKTAAERAGSDESKYAWRADCTTKFDFGDEIGIATLSTTGEHGAELPVIFKLDSELEDQTASADADETEELDAGDEAPDLF